MTNFTKKVLHLVKESEIKPRVRRPFNPAVDPVFVASEMFHPKHEVSNFFDMFLPAEYVEVTVMNGDGDQSELESNVSWFERIGREGLKIKGVTHRVIFGDWDDDGVAIMVPVDMVKDLAQLGLRLHINKESDKAKVRKYFRRVRAHHEWAVSGRIAGGPFHSTNGQVLEIALDHSDITFQMLHVDLNSAALGSDDQARKYNVALADGIHLIDVDLCRKMGEAYDVEKLKNAKVGDAFKGTAMAYLGLGKGFFHVVANPMFGLVLYGPKKQVEFDQFFLGSLGEVKGGDAYTDLQAMINFDQHAQGLAYNQAVLFIQQIHAAIHNEKKLRHLFLRNLKSVAEVLGNEAEGGREAWVLIEAIRYGVSLRKNPGLFRRVVNHLLTHVLDATAGRIPFMDIAARFNLMPDLNCFRNADGNYDGAVDFRRSSIPEEAVVCMDLNQGPFAMYRQPSGHKKELVSTTNIHSRRFRAFRGLNRVILGPSAYYMLRTMGGGDMDDAVVASDNLTWIEVMASGDYPLEALPESDNTLTDLHNSNPYRRVSTYPRTWSMADFFEATAKALDIKGLTIGVVVNAIMLDELLSGEHKENMLTVLADRIADAKNEEEKDTYRKAYDWLRARKDRQLNVVASNLEAFIDFGKTGEGDAAVLNSYVSLINNIRNNSHVFPESFMLKNKKGFARIPGYRLEAGDFVTAPSLVCDTLTSIHIEVQKLQEALTEEEWLNVDSIPESLNSIFPSDRGYRDLAIEQRGLWREAFQNRNGADLRSLYQSVLENVIRPSWNDKELGLNVDDKMQLAVEHARLTYRGRKIQAEKGDNGRFRHYPDGLLWTNTIGAFYIKALLEAGLTGLYVPVQFDKWSRNYSRGNHWVNVLGGIVIAREDGMILGTTMDDVENGDYFMEDGLITVMEPADELHADSTTVNDAFSNPIDLDQVGQESDDDIFANFA